MADLRPKRPAYQWHVLDARADEAYRLMTYEQRGVYRELLDHQWIEGSIPGNPGDLARMLGIEKQRFARLWPKISKKFQHQGGDRLLNARLERYRTELEDFLAQQAERGRKGAEARWHRHSPSNGAGNAQAMPKMASVSVSVSKKKTVDKEHLQSSSTVTGTKHQSREPADKTPAPARAFLTWFQTEYKARRDGAAYFVVWEKHMPLVGRLLKLHDQARLRLHATILLTTDDEWIESTDRGIEVLSTKINWLEDRLAAWEAKRQLAPV